MEEIGIDLNTSDYIPVGKLDEREISSIKDNKLLMILIPFGKLYIINVITECTTKTTKNKKKFIYKWYLNHQDLNFKNQK